MCVFVCVCVCVCVYVRPNLTKTCVDLERQKPSDQGNRTYCSRFIVSETSILYETDPRDIKLFTLPRYKAATKTCPFIFPTIPVHFSLHESSHAELNGVSSSDTDSPPPQHLIESYSDSSPPNVAGNFKQKQQQQQQKSMKPAYDVTDSNGAQTCSL
jgi:hypothetical protein